MAKPAIEFQLPDDLAWQPIPGNDKQKERILARDPDTALVTRMLQFLPGCQTAEVLTHDFWEEIWIISGSLTDLRLHQTFTAGMFACRPPGMPHGPWVSPDGCVTFEVRYR